MNCCGVGYLFGSKLFQKKGGDFFNKTSSNLVAIFLESEGNFDEVRTK